MKMDANDKHDGANQESLTYSDLEIFSKWFIHHRSMWNVRAHNIICNIRREIYFWISIELQISIVIHAYSFELN